MSGVVASYNRIGLDVAREEGDAMLASIAHRGPDSSVVWCEGRAALGHCALFTTPESACAALPMRHPESGVVLSCDARIDNRDELIKRLALQGRPPAELADATLILHAYLKWGLESPRHLIGDFAFVLWDPRRDRMVLARDVMGIKPLYYYGDPERAYVASEIRGLLSSGEVPPAINEEMLANLLVPVFSDSEQTAYRGIFRVPRAHVVVIEPDRIRKHRYYHFDVDRELKLASDAAYVEAFRSVFEEAVRCRLRAAPDSPGVGTTLSGGLDSSSVACVARSVLDPATPLHTFSAVFPSVVPLDPRIDERAYIDAVLESRDFTPHVVEADTCRPVSDLLDVRPDEPIAAPSLYMSKAIMEATRDNGLRVLLSGFDGDVAVSYGFEQLVSLARQMAWGQFADEIKTYAGRRGVDDLGHYFRLFGVPVLEELARDRDVVGYARSVARVPATLGYTKLRLWRHFGLPGLFGRGVAAAEDNKREHGLNRTLNQAFVNRSGVAGRVIAAREASRGQTNALRAQHVQGLDDGRIEFAVGVFDQLGSRLGVEQRYPFLDRRVLELCIAMPFEQRFRDGWTRSYMRRAMSGILPERVQWRVGKADLSANVRMRLADEVALITQTLSASDALTADYVAPDKISAIISQLKRSPLDLTENDVFGLFVAVSLAEWLKRRVV